MRSPAKFAIVRRLAFLNGTIGAFQRVRCVKCVAVCVGVMSVSGIGAKPPGIAPARPLVEFKCRCSRWGSQRPNRRCEPVSRANLADEPNQWDVRPREIDNCKLDDASLLPNQRRGRGR